MSGSFLPVSLGRNILAVILSCISVLLTLTATVAASPRVISVWPAFVFFARDDKTVHHQVAGQFYAALRRDGVPVKLVEFKHGKHGFGLGRKGTDTTQWPRDCFRWLKQINVLSHYGLRW